MSPSALVARRSRSALTALFAMLVVSAVPRVASGQRVGGAIGVSLTVLPPATAARSVAVTDLRVDRDGVATIGTSEPGRAAASQIVMTRIVSDAGTELRASTSAVTTQHGSAATASRDVRYRVVLARSVDGEPPRDVRLRIEYLAVAGT